MIVVTQAFKLADGVDRQDFVRADKSLQEDVLYQDPAFIRRTVAYNEADDEWAVVTFLWDNAASTALPVGEGADLASMRTQSYRDVGG